MEPNNNGPAPEKRDSYESLQVPPPLPSFGASHIPVRKPRKLWIPGLILLIAGLGLFGAGWLSGSRGGSIYLDDDGFHMDINKAGEENGITVTEMDLPAFEVVDVKSGFADIEFIPSDNYGIEIHVPSFYKPEWEVENGKLEINVESEGDISLQLFNTGFLESGIWIYYPEDANFESIKLKSGSGGINAEIGYVNDKIELQSGSGDIDAVFYEGVEAEVKTGSGSIDLLHEGNGYVKAKVESGSGGINIYGNIWRDLEAKTGSGSIEVEGVLQGETDIERGSGSVEVNYEFDGVQGYDISSGTGAIYVNGERHTKNFKEHDNMDDMIKIKTGSGRIEVNYD
jgi:hypothetical protein